MKISHISTGKKLNDRTFEELKIGDTVYWASWRDKSIEDTIYTVKNISLKENVEWDSYTDLNPDKAANTLCDIVLKVKNTYGTYSLNVPSNAKYIVIDDVVITTDKELLLQTIKKYNLDSFLV